MPLIPSWLLIGARWLFISIDFEFELVISLIDSRGSQTIQKTFVRVPESAGNFTRRRLYGRLQWAQQQRPNEIFETKCSLFPSPHLLLI